MIRAMIPYCRFIFGQERFICDCGGSFFLGALGTRSRAVTQGAGGEGWLNAIKVVIRCRFHASCAMTSTRSFVTAATSSSSPSPSSRGLHDLLPLSPPPPLFAPSVSCPSISSSRRFRAARRACPREDECLSTRARARATISGN